MVDSADVLDTIQKAVDGDLVPMGDYTSRPDGEGYVVTYPRTAHRFNEIDSESDFKVWMDTETGAVVYLPD